MDCSRVWVQVVASCSGELYMVSYKYRYHPSDSNGAAPSGRFITVPILANREQLKSSHFLFYSLWYYGTIYIFATEIWALVFLISGSLLGWTSPIQIKFQQDDDFTLNDTQVAWLVIYLLLGMACAPIPTIIIADFIGRKLTLLATVVPFLASWVLIMLAQTKIQLYIGRFVGGFGIGSSFAVAPMYVIEITDPSLRPPLSSVFQLMFSIGVLYEYAFGPYISPLMLGIASALLLVLLVFTVIWIPESPYFYVMTNRTEAAEKSLSRLQRGITEDALATELNIVLRYIEYNARQGVGLKDLVSRKVNRKALLYLLGLFWSQEFTGIVPILSFMPRIFQLSAIVNDIYVVSIMFGVLFVVFSAVATIAVTQYGRRNMLMFSTIGCTVSLTALGISFFLSEEKAIRWLPILSMGTYIIFFALGLGPLPWVIATEVFSSAVIYMAISIAVMFTAFLAIIAVFIFDELGGTLDIMYIPFFIFAALTACSFIWIIFYLPETKDKSLMAMFVEFGGLDDLSEHPVSVTHSIQSRITKYRSSK